MKKARKEIKSKYYQDDTVFSISSPHIEIESNCSATVEGCKGILEYDSDNVKINCENITVKFTGDCLQIHNITSQRICVYGNIFSVEFCT